MKIFSPYGAAGQGQPQPFLFRVSESFFFLQTFDRPVATSPVIENNTDTNTNAFI